MEAQYQWVFELCTMGSRAAYRIALGLLLTFVLGLSALLLAVGVTPANLFANDHTILLDGAWRILHGQRPHLDWYSPLGPLPYLLCAFGMVAVGPCASATACGNVLLFGVLSLWAWLIASSRLSAVTALLFAALVGAITIGTHPLGHRLSDTSYAMLYNRQGFALLSIVVLEVFLAPRHPRSRDQIIGGLSTGALTAALLFTKASYFLVAVAAVALAHLLRSGSRRWQAAYLAGGLAVLVPLVVFLQGGLGAMAGDLRLAAAARGPGFLAPWNLLVVTGYSVTPLLCLLMAWLVAPRVEKPEAGGLASRPLGLALGFMALAGLMLVNSNCQWSDLPLIPVAALVLFEHAGRQWQGKTRQGTKMPGVQYLCLAFFVLYPLGHLLCKDLAGIGYSAYLHYRVAPSVPYAQRIHSPSLGDLVVLPRNDERNQVPYVAKINDGLALLRPRLRPESRILTLDSNNPFSHLLLQIPPHSGAAWLNLGTSIGPRAFPPPQRLFREVTLLMVPKPAADPTGNGAFLRRAYRDYVRQHFRWQAESRYWALLARYR